MLVADDLEALRQRMSKELALQLPGHLERLRWSADRLAAHQRERLPRCSPTPSNARRSTPSGCAASIPTASRSPICPACR